MATNAELREMTLEQKLAAMETLWKELSRTPELIDSPAWHRQLLDERR